MGAAPYTYYIALLNPSQVIPKTNRAYYPNEGVITLKETLHTKSTFKSTDAKRLKKAVTEKIEKLVNDKLKKAG